MRLVLAAVGQRQPGWADAAYEDFAKRFPPEMRLELKAVKAEPRGAKTAEQLMAAEAVRLEAAVPKGARRVVLDERGERIGTAQLAQRLQAWQRDGRDVVIFIGGPDGLHPDLKARADDTLRLSDLTLPHAFVRVLLAEALYRAWTVMVN
ncbi:MAG TPA: 23S rRNA (pseudouridine(1915)-N(3))-methyltransferase RlmH, partial [Piscinibacter sp.]|nr:23S rRNA (pseudouridine(1915)-N(3))-methyltransferase RlmH [Piscinibacter sp.]